MKFPFAVPKSRKCQKSECVTGIIEKKVPPKMGDALQNWHRQTAKIDDSALDGMGFPSLKQLRKDLNLIKSSVPPNKNKVKGQKPPSKSTILSVVKSFEITCPLPIIPCHQNLGAASNDPSHSSQKNKKQQNSQRNPLEISWKHHGNIMEIP